MHVHVEQKHKRTMPRAVLWRALVSRQLRFQLCDPRHICGAIIVCAVSCMCSLCVACGGVASVVCGCEGALLAGEHARELTCGVGQLLLRPRQLVLHMYNINQNFKVPE